MVLPAAVGGWVCGVQKVCGQKQEHFPLPSKFSGAFVDYVRQWKNRNNSRGCARVCICVWGVGGARAGGGVGKVQRFLLIVYLILPAFDFI